MNSLLKAGTDHIIVLAGQDTADIFSSPLTNGLTGETVEGAECSCRLLSHDGQEIAGTWPIELTEDSNYPGIYYGTLPYSVLPAAGTRVLLEVVANAGPGLQRTWTVPLRVNRGE